MKALIKIQYVDSIVNNEKAKEIIVGQRLKAVDKRGILDEAVDKLELGAIMARKVGQLSGGELQRFTIAMTCVQQADLYMFDEPSSYLDVKQRLNAGRMIRSLLKPEVYVVCIEHDLSILDYLSDFICCLYGQPGAYGVVTMPSSVREGINIFLAGFVPTENVRFREDELTFRVQKAIETEEESKEIVKPNVHSYPAMTKTLGSFKVNIEAGRFQSA